MTEWANAAGFPASSSRQASGRHAPGPRGNSPSTLLGDPARVEAEAEVQELQRINAIHQDSLPMDIPFEHHAQLIGELQHWLHENPAPGTGASAPAAGPSSAAPPPEDPMQALREQAEAMLFEAVRKELSRPAAQSAPAATPRTPGGRLAHAQARSDLCRQMAQIAKTQLPHLWTEDDRKVLEAKTTLTHAHLLCEKFLATGQLEPSELEKMLKGLAAMEDDPHPALSHRRMTLSGPQGADVIHIFPIKTQAEAARLLQTPVIRLMKHQVNATKPLLRQPAELLLKVLRSLTQTDQPDLYQAWVNVRQFKSTSVACRNFIEGPQFQMLEDLIKWAADLVEDLEPAANNAGSLVDNMEPCARMMGLLGPKTREKLVATVEQLPHDSVVDGAAKAMAIGDILPGLSLLDDGQKDRLIAAALAIPDDFPRSLAIGKLASSPHLSPAQLGTLLDGVGQLTDEPMSCAMALAGFGSTLQSLDKAQQLPKLMALARSACVYVEPDQPAEDDAEEEARLHDRKFFDAAAAIAASGTRGKPQGRDAQEGFLSFAPNGWIGRREDGDVYEYATTTFRNKNLDNWHPDGLLQGLEHMGAEDAAEVMRGFKPYPQNLIDLNGRMQRLLSGREAEPSGPGAPDFMRLKRIRLGFDPMPAANVRELCPDNIDKACFRALADQAHHFPAATSRVNQKAMLDKALAQIRKRSSADQFLHEVHRLNQDVRCKLDMPYTHKIEAVVSQMNHLGKVLQDGLRDKDVPLAQKESFLSELRKLQSNLISKAFMASGDVNEGQARKSLKAMQDLVGNFIQGLPDAAPAPAPDPGPGPGPAPGPPPDDEKEMLTILNQRLANFQPAIRREIFDGTMGLTQEATKIMAGGSIDLAALEPERSLNIRAGVRDRCDTWFDMVMTARKLDVKAIGVISLINNLPSLRKEQADQTIAEAIRLIQPDAKTLAAAAGKPLPKGMLINALGVSALKHMDTAQKNVLLSQFEDLDFKKPATLWNPIPSLQGLVDGMAHFDKGERLRLFNLMMALKEAGRSPDVHTLLSAGERKFDQRPLRGMASQMRLLEEPQQKVLLDMIQDRTSAYDPANLAADDERDLENEFRAKSEVLWQVAQGGWATIDKFFGVPLPT